MTNNNTKKLDLPIWELMNQAPTTSSATSALCTSEDGSNRFIYYLVGSAFYRYDTQTDSWQQLANPNTAPSTAVSMRYTTQRGYHARILSATSNTVTIAGLRGKVLDGEVMRIDRGTGQGQERTLTFQSETVHDFGLITAVVSGNVGITDSLKKWKVNQWAGYLVGITFGTDATQYKKILYNSVDTLYIADVNLMPHDPWNNQVFAANAPYALPVTTAGSQAHFEIISQTFTVPTWDVIPDYTSFAQIKSGGIYLVSSATSAPFFTLQYYDVAHDSWTTKTCNQGLIGTSLGTDFSFERLAKISSYVSGTASSATNRTLVDSTKTLTVDRYRNYRIVITGGTGIGQTRRVVSNTDTTFHIERNWDTNPDATSTYEIHNDFRKMMLAGGALSAMIAYNPEYDFWSHGEFSDYGIALNSYAKMNGWEALGISSGVRIAAGVRAINPVPTAGGTGYSIGDVLTCSVGGTGAQVIVTSIAPGGIVTGIELMHIGTATGFTTGTGKATTGGTGTGCTIEITSVGATALVTLATSHWFKIGDSITIGGMSDSAWNTTYTILGVPGTTTFCISLTAAANASAALSQSTTTLVDTTQNWVVNEHAGKLVHLSVAGLAPTAQVRWIVSNTANTLTIQGTWTAGTNGASKYVIYDSKLFGVDVQYKQEFRRGYGHATGGSTTTLVDSSKNWIPNQWAGYRFRIDAGTGLGSGLISITSNTENTLTYTTQTFTPDSSTMYEIQDTWGLMTAGSATTITEATTKNWLVNQWAGKRAKVTSGTSVTSEVTITSNTATVLTVGTISAPDTSSAYCIFGIPVRGAGIELIHVNGLSDSSQKGKYLFCPRGTLSNTADIYDITTGRWTYGYFFSPQSELPTTGSSYAYDGADTIFFTKTASGVNPRLFAYNIITNKVTGGGQIPDLDGTATIGNRMEIINTEAGKFLYWLQSTGTKMFRSLIWYI